MLNLISRQDCNLPRNQGFKPHGSLSRVPREWRFPTAETHARLSSTVSMLQKQFLRPTSLPVPPVSSLSHACSIFSYFRDHRPCSTSAQPYKFEPSMSMVLTGARWSSHLSGSRWPVLCHFREPVEQGSPAAVILVPKRLPTALAGANFAGLRTMCSCTRRRGWGSQR